MSPKSPPQTLDDDEATLKEESDSIEIAESVESGNASKDRTLAQLMTSLPSGSMSSETGTTSEAHEKIATTSTTSTTVPNFDTSNSNSGAEQGLDNVSTDAPNQQTLPSNAPLIDLVAKLTSIHSSNLVDEELESALVGQATVNPALSASDSPHQSALDSTQKPSNTNIESDKDGPNKAASLGDVSQLIHQTQLKQSPSLEQNSLSSKLERLAAKYSPVAPNPSGLRKLSISSDAVPVPIRPAPSPIVKETNLIPAALHSKNEDLVVKEAVPSPTVSRAATPSGSKRLENLFAELELELESFDFGDEVQDVPAVALKVEEVAPKDIVSEPLELKSEYGPPPPLPSQSTKPLSPPRTPLLNNSRPTSPNPTPTIVESNIYTVESLPSNRTTINSLDSLFTELESFELPPTPQPAPSETQPTVNEQKPLTKHQQRKAASKPMRKVESLESQTASKPPTIPKLSLPGRKISTNKPVVASPLGITVENGEELETGLKRRVAYSGVRPDSMFSSMRNDSDGLGSRVSGAVRSYTESLASSESRAITGRGGSSYLVAASRERKMKQTSASSTRSRDTSDTQSIVPSVTSSSGGQSVSYNEGRDGRASVDLRLAPMTPPQPIRGTGASMDLVPPQPVVFNGVTVDVSQAYRGAVSVDFTTKPISAPENGGRRMSSEMTSKPALRVTDIAPLQPEKKKKVFGLVIPKFGSGRGKLASTGSAEQWDYMAQREQIASKWDGAARGGRGSSMDIVRGPVVSENVRGGSFDFVRGSVIATPAPAFRSGSVDLARETHRPVLARGSSMDMIREPNRSWEMDVVRPNSSDIPRSSVPMARVSEQDSMQPDSKPREKNRIIAGMKKGMGKSLSWFNLKKQ
ncbi:hypothetical protein HDU79_007994 [Rhizoclosmatium sp. JEL0117]|nr:hypothetical protein HDU79_007994 [Rhizoclosmatium sp. JEL0117]